MTAFLTLAFIFVILALAVVVAFFGIKDTIKDVGNFVNLAKEETSHITGENTQNQGQHWIRIKWFAIGAATMFLCAKIFSFFIIPLISSICTASRHRIFCKQKRPGKQKRKKKILYPGSL